MKPASLTIGVKTRPAAIEYPAVCPIAPLLTRYSNVKGTRAWSAFS